MHLQQLEAIKERTEFSKRFALALEQTNKSKLVVDVWREFNALNTHAPVTTHTVRKWLTGEAIPAQPKLRTLADWLGVSVAWIRFGDDAAAEVANSLSSQEQALVTEYRKLAPLEKIHFLELMRAVTASKEKK